MHGNKFWFAKIMCFCSQESYLIFCLFVCLFVCTGIVGTLITGYVLEVGHRWEFVFNLNAVVLVFGASAFLMYGTAKKIA